MNLKAEDPHSIANLRFVPHLTLSGITDYLRCGLLYKFRRIDGFEMDPVPDHVVFKSVIRKVLIEFNAARMEGKKPTIVSMQEHFAHYWKTETRGNYVLYRPGMNQYKTLAEGRNLIEALYIWFPRDRREILSVKECFEFKIDGVDVPIIGEIDLVERDSSFEVIVTDFRKAAQICSVNRIDMDLRLTLLYMAALSKGFIEAELLLQSIFPVKSRSRRIAQCFTKRTDGDVKRAKKIIESVWDGIAKNVFIPNPDDWKCHACGYKGHCTAWFNDIEA